MLKTAIILAGGLGTRLREVVPNVPKPMAIINGRPFLEYLLDYWISQGILRFILSVGYKYEIIQNYFGTQYRNAKIEYVIEDHPLGTGGGLKLALQSVDETVLLLNGDTFFAVPLSRLCDFALNTKADCVLSLFKAEDRVRYLGVGLNDEGRITQLASQDSVLANGGVYWIKDKVIDTAHPIQACSFEQDVLPQLLLNQVLMYGLPVVGKFIDIGIPHDFRRAGVVLS